MLRWLLILWGWLFGRKPKAEEGPKAIRLNRAERRMVMRSQRLKGPGYTRAMRKGRKQRTRFDA